MCYIVQAQTHLIKIWGEIPIEIFEILNDSQWEDPPPTYKSRCSFHQGKILKSISFWGHNLTNVADPICGTIYRIIIRDLFNPSQYIEKRGCAPFVCFPQEIRKGGKLPIFLAGCHPLPMGNNFEPEMIICEIVIEALESAPKMLIEV